jgi:mannobiose 2-epimerase
MAAPGPRLPARTMNALEELRSETWRELVENILPFSARIVIDRERGGFYGQVANDGTVRPEAPKGLVQHSRMMWTFARAGRVTGEPEYVEVARHAYRTLTDWFWDAEHGGLFWMVDCAGQPLETSKFVYGQAFALYALAEQARATEDAGCLEWATELYRLIEEHCDDPADAGYWEASERDWALAPDGHVDPTPLPVAKGMNTHLHLLEAYANLLLAWQDAALRERLAALIELFLDRIIDPATGRLALFFDRAWRPLSDRVSAGHDIEASWLLVEAAEVLGEPELAGRARAAGLRMAGAVLKGGVDADGGLWDEEPLPGASGRTKSWWPQAEAMVGFLNAYQLGGDPRFLDAALGSWGFIRERLVDREDGEWFSAVDQGGRALDLEKPGPWKTPYHGARACLEVAERVRKLGVA